MPTNPNLLERLLLYRLNRAPAPMLDLFGAGSLQALLLADDLGVLDELSDGSRPLTELADAVDADPVGLDQLCRFLESQGYVESTTAGLTLTRMTERWATDTHGTNMVPWFRFWDDVVFPFWDQHLESAVRTGDPEQTIYEWLDDNPDHWPTAQAGFRAAASILVDEVTTKLDLPADVSTVLDVGGGHGYYTLELLDQRPELQATVFDRPEALDVARHDATTRGLDDRLTLVGGDYTTDDLGTEQNQYDAVLLFNVIHAHDELATRALFERIIQVLRPGGRLVVLDQFSDRARMPVGRAGIGFVSLTYYATLGATVHEYAAVENWLGDAGYTDVSETPIRRAGPGNALVHATKPDAR